MTDPAAVPLCSVVVPVRNDAAHLRRFLAALERQTSLPDEVIVVDNASSDDSASVGERWGARVVEESRISIPFAAATGYNAAAGRIIIRADADTLPPQDWIHRLLSHLTGSTEIVAASGAGRFYGLPPLTSKITSLLYFGTYVCSAGLALGHPPLFGTNLAFRRSWWNQVRHAIHLHPGVHDDMDLSFRLRPGEIIVCDPTICVGMSARPLVQNRWTRWRRGVETIRVNWSDEYPWERRAARRRRTA